MKLKSISILFISIKDTQLEKGKNYSLLKLSTLSYLTGKHSAQSLNGGLTYFWHSVILSQVGKVCQNHFAF